VQAGLLAGSSYEIVAAGGSNIVLLDVTPLSMGIETTGARLVAAACAAMQS
jgi:molecular chaperone DnaK (HSP70)